MADPSPLVTALRAAIGEGAVSTEPDDLRAYGRDWTKVIEPRPSMIVFPRSTDEVAAVVHIVASAGAAIVPSGGRTGLAAGAVAANGEVVLSLARMRKLGPVDALAMTV